MIDSHSDRTSISAFISGAGLRDADEQKVFYQCIALDDDAPGWRLSSRAETRKSTDRMASLQRLFDEQPAYVAGIATDEHIVPHTPVYAPVH